MHTRNICIPSFLFCSGIMHFVISIQEASLFNQKNNNNPQDSYPKNWKGKNGVYSVGFARQGVLGISMDAHKVADDIASQWNSETRHLWLDS